MKKIIIEHLIQYIFVLLIGLILLHFNIIKYIYLYMLCAGIVSIYFIFRDYKKLNV